MKQKIILLSLVLGLLLSGCGSWMAGNYVSVRKHEEKASGTQPEVVTASNYYELRTVLTQMVDFGTESTVINIEKYNQKLVESSMEKAVSYLKDFYPIGAYAIDTIDYEVGIAGGKSVILVNISYIHGRSELRAIRAIEDMEHVRSQIKDALESCADSLVLYVKNYSKLDLVQWVEDCAQLYPDQIMETPEVAVGVYPNVGTSRVLELKFTYLTSRDVLRQMQLQVKPIFSSAVLYVGNDTSDLQKYEHLYSFLMERFDYKIETSITPPYSLLCHGVGDAQTFAMVYAAMCRQAGLDCRVVSGTRAGEPWYWNILSNDGKSCHLDLLQCSTEGGFCTKTDEQMIGYVWDYSGYSSVSETQSDQT